jgi:ribonuclease P protein subunit RPR2
MKNSSIVKDIAKERIVSLASLAEKENDEKLALRYSRLMKRISLHYKVPLPKEIKKRICRGCGMLMSPGKNCVVRLVSSKRYVLYTCTRCKKENRLPY